MFRWSFLKSPSKPKIVLKGPESEGCMVDLQIGLTPKISKKYHFCGFFKVWWQMRVLVVVFFANKIIQLAKIRASIQFNQKPVGVMRGSRGKSETQILGQNSLKSCPAYYELACCRTCRFSSLVLGSCRWPAQLLDDASSRKIEENWY